MKITDQQIVDTARKQRDNAREQMTVRQWKPQKARFHVPLWLTAMPAAAIAGFFFGITFQQDDQSALTALVDTVYVTREVPVPQASDTVIRYVNRPVRNAKTTAKPAPSTGLCVGQDNINYSMLVLK